MIFKNKGKLLKAAERFVLQGRFEQAIAQYMKVVEADPQDLSTLNIIGDLHTRVGQNQAAIIYYSRVAEQYRSFNYLPKAIAMYKKMELLAPQNLDIALTLADLYAEEGLKGQARKQYRQVIAGFQAQGKENQTVPVLQKIIQLDPEDPDALGQLGQIHVAMNDPVNAERYLLDAAEIHRRRGSLASARGTFLQVLMLNNAQLAALRGLLASSSSPLEREDALARIQRCREQKPQESEALELQGQALLSLGRIDEAERVFVRLLELDESLYYRNLRLLAERLIPDGRVDEAVLQIRRIAAPLLTNRELDSGLNLLEKILESNPRHTGALSLTADLYLKANQEALAAPALERLAQVLSDAGQWDEALLAAQRLLELPSATEQQRGLHRRIFGQGYPGESYTPPSLRKDRPLQAASRSGQFAATGPEEPSARSPVLEFGMLLRYGMLDKAHSLLLDILKQDPGDAWAREQLVVLERELQTAAQSASMTHTDPGAGQTGGLTMPSWMTESAGAGAPPASALKAGPVAMPLKGESGNADEEIVEPRLPRSVIAPAGSTPLEMMRQSGLGPGSLDSVAASPLSVAAPNDQPVLYDSTSPESLKEVLSEAEIIDAVESFFELPPPGRVTGASEDPPGSALGADGSREDERFDSLFSEGQAKQQMGLFQEAIPAFQAALESLGGLPAGSRFVGCCTSLGACCLQMGEARKAIEWFQRPFRDETLDREQIMALKYELATAYETLGDLAHARLELEWINQWNPQYRNVGQRLKRMEQASL